VITLQYAKNGASQIARRCPHIVQPFDGGELSSLTWQACGDWWQGVGQGIA